MPRNFRVKYFGNISGGVNQDSVGWGGRKEFSTSKKKFIKLM